MNYWKDVPMGEDAPAIVNAIIEIPKGSQNKYEYDKDLQLFKLDRVLFSPLHYPGDYGFIPQTLEEDGDPADVLVLMNFPTYPGMLMEVKPIGVLPMIDNGEPDHKVLCVPAKDVRFKSYSDISDIEEPVLAEIGHFFQVYKELEGKTVKLDAWRDVKVAHEVILAAQKRYQEQVEKK